MKRLYISKLVILIAAVFGCGISAVAQTTCYNTVGTYNYTVPAGCNVIQADITGAQGGAGYNSNAGGKGGRVVANINVTPGQVLIINVGGKGTNGNCCSGTYYPGGTNGVPDGGAGGGRGYYYGGGGGASTDIRSLAGSSTGSLNSRIIVAGGGGAGAYNCSSGMYGGDGGGLTGGTGYSCSSITTCQGGNGGTQTAGGVGATCYSSVAGSLGAGAAQNGVNNYNGGGGGGYYGGGGGYYGGGGGGSSFFNSPGVTMFTNTAAYQSGDGYACITPLLPALFSTNLTMDFGTLPVGQVSVPMYTELRGQYLSPATGNITVTPPSGYELSVDGGATWSTGIQTFPYTGGVLSTTKLWVRFTAGAPTCYNNLLTFNGGGLPLPYTFPVLGCGSNTACSGTPAAGTATVLPTAGSSGTFFTLTLSGVSLSTGIFYQWQSSANTGGPWADIPGANRASFTFGGINATTSYRCKVSCGLGTAAFSTVTTATYVAGTQNAIVCSGTPNPGRTYLLTPSGCSPYPENLYVVGATQDSGITHQIQFSLDNLSWGNVVGATGPGLTQNITQTIYYRDLVTCKVSGNSIYGSTVSAILNTAPDPISGVTPLCSGYASSYSSTTPLGTWTSSNPAVALVDAVTGLVSPVTGGTAIISYTTSNGCSTTAALTVNASPAAITGITKVCSVGGGSASSTTLSDATPGGTWSSSDISQATVAGGVVTGVSALGSFSYPLISYTLPNGCSALTTVTVAQQPAAIGGPGAVCEGSGITLTNSIAGGTWTSTNSFWANITPTTGFVTGITGGTAPTISYTLNGGCYSTKVITVNSLPAAITGTPQVCVNATTSLTDAGGGAWSSSNISIAKVGSTGVVTGIAKGAADIVYTLPGTGCQATVSVTVNALPNIFSVTGTGGYCFGSPGAHVGLNSSNPGVNYSVYETSAPGTLLNTVPGSSSGLDFGVYLSGTYKVLATDLTTNCTVNMSDSAKLQPLSLPADYPVSQSAPSYCLGGTGVKFTIGDVDNGINYEIHYGTASTLVKTIGGTSTHGITDLGMYKTAGSYTVIAVNPTTGCSQVMSGSPMSVSIDTLPVIFPVTATSNTYCAGGAGVSIQLATSTSGISYYLLKNGIALSTATVVSTGGLVDFSGVTAAGTYTVKGFTAAGCTSTMSNSIPLTVSPLPAVQTMNGGGSFCTGSAGAHVGLTYAISGTTYNLFNTTDLINPVGTMNGANASLDFGAINVAGSYIVVAVSAAGCTNNMSGIKTIIENSRPTSQNVIGGGGYCIGSTGATIVLTPSENGISYRLFRTGTTPTLVATKTSTLTGSSLSFGPYTTTGNYYITAIDPTTGCTNNMTGSVNISLNSLPIAYKVFAVNGGGYCANDTAWHIKTSGSTPGVKYTLYRASVAEGAYLGTGDSLDLGGHATPGIYYVIAEDTITHCVQNLLGTATISINPLPTVYNVSVSGTGSYCAGGAGLSIKLSGSNTGINYMLYKDNAPTGITLGGVGKALDFGLQTAGGVYTVNAFNTATHCLDTMNSNGTITVIPLPTQYTVTPAAAKYCPGGAGADVTLDNSDAGFNYRLYKDGVLADTMIGGASPLDFGNRKVGNYTVVAVDGTYGCVKNMSGSTNVSNYPVPTAYTVTGTGSFCPIGFPGAPVTLSNSDTGVSYTLYRAGSGTPLTTVPGTKAGLTFTGLIDFDTYTITATDNYTTCSNTMTGSAIISASTPDVVGVTISTPNHNVCLGDSAVFTPKTTGGGTSPSYIWLVNSTPVTGATNSTFTYTPTSVKGIPDTIKVLLTSSSTCTWDPAEYSNDTEGYVTVANPVTPAVSITSSDPVVCAPKKTTPVVFTASPVQPGAAPIYQWKKNGLPVGSNLPSYSTTINDSDVIFCVMRSSAACHTAEFVYSNPITERIADLVVPSVVVTADPGTDVQKGTSVVFSATVGLAKDTLNTHLYYTYQWYKNNVAIAGATSVAYTTSNYSNNDGISCTVTSHNTCGTASNTQQVFMTVGTLGVQNATAAAITAVQVVPNPNKGTFVVKGSLATTAEEEVALDVTNMLGQVVYTNKVIAHDGKIDQQVQLKNSLANGMYLLNLRTATDHKVFHFVLEQ